MGPNVTQSIELPPGIDLLSATGTIHVSVPADFFGEGSPSFTGDVAATGAVVGTAGAYELGTTSLVMHRMSAVSLPLPQSAEEYYRVAVEKFSVIGDAPISIVTQGTAVEWVVAAGIAPNATAHGTIEIMRTGATSGDLGGTLVAPLELVFQKGDGERRTLDCGLVVLAIAGGSWTIMENSPSAGLALTGLPLGLALSMTMASTVLDLQVSPAGIDGGRPGPEFLDPSAMVNPAVGSLGRGCSVSTDATISARAIVGPRATIGSGAYVGEGAIVGESASMGEGAVIGEGVVIASFAVISSGVIVLSNSVIGSHARIGPSGRVGPDVKLGSWVVMEGGGVIGAGSVLGKSVHLGRMASVGPGIEIAPGARVAALADQQESLVACQLEDGTVEYRSMPPSSWPAGAAPVVILGNVSMGAGGGGAGGQGGSGGPVGPPPSTSYTPTGPGNTPQGYGALGGDIGNDIAPPPGGSGQPYGDGYQCGWFAEELRRKLEGKGYDTTFTITFLKNPDNAWWAFWEPEYTPMLQTCFTSDGPRKPPAARFGLESRKGCRRPNRTAGDFQ